MARLTQVPSSLRKLVCWTGRRAIVLYGYLSAFTERAAGCELSEER